MPSTACTAGRYLFRRYALSAAINTDNNKIRK